VSAEPIRERLSEGVVFRAMQSDDSDLATAMRRVSRQKTVSMFDVDVIAVKVLRTHPCFIYPEWFDVAA
jgi:hypothetical protein